MKLAPLSSLAVMFALAACGSGGATPSPGSGSGALGSGSAHADPSRLSPKDAYLTLCAVCHAAKMEGGAADHAPSLVSPTFAESATDDFLRRSIAFGRPGTSMAAYSKQLGGPLDDAAITGIIALIRTTGGVPQKELAPLVRAGDVTRGAALYQKNCQTCHGDTVARGQAIHLANPRFLEVATDAFIHYAIENGRPNTKMVAWKAVLSTQDIDDTTAYVRNFTGKAQAPQPLLPAPTGDEPLVINPKGKRPQFKLTEDKYVTVDQVKAALDAKQRVIIIDARPPSEWRQVHVEGAVSIPYHDMARLDQIPKDGTWTIAYCACPHHLSGIVMDELRKRGYQNAVVLDEGINEWFRRGYPVVAAPGTKPPPKEAPDPSAPPPPPSPGGR